MDVLDHQGESDARLTAAAGRGDDEAFAVLYVRYAPRIEAYLQRLLSDEHLAQDLTHEVFVSALVRLRTARPPIAFGPWLYRIARNASIDVHRRSQLVRQVPLPGPEDEVGVLSGNAEPQDQAEMRQWLDDLRDLLGGLSDSHRSVLVLRELEGLSNGEIAERLGVSRPAVEGLLFRARAKMRAEYEDLTSGRRCARVQTAVDRARAGEDLGRRELALASRHLTGCKQCRRHAWEAGVSDLLRPRARAFLPLPLLGLFGRLSDHGPLFAAPWGRTAAVTAVVVAGGAVAPRVHHADTASARPTPLAVQTASAAPTALAAGRAPGLRSPASVATALPRPVAAVAPERRRSTVTSSAPAAATPAPAPAARQPGAPAPAGTPAHNPVAAPTPSLPAAPEKPAPSAAAARTRETVASVTAPVSATVPAPVPAAQTTAAVDQATETAAAAVEHALPPVEAPRLEVAPVVPDPVEVLRTPVLPAVEAPATPALPAIAPTVPAIG